MKHLYEGIWGFDKEGHMWVKKLTPKYWEGQCPVCKGDFEVLETDWDDVWFWQKCKCEKCGATFTKNFELRYDDIDEIVVNNKEEKEGKK